MNDVRPPTPWSRLTPRRVAAGIRRRVAECRAMCADVAARRAEIDELRARADALTIQLDRTRRELADAVVVGDAVLGSAHDDPGAVLDDMVVTSDGDVRFERSDEPAVAFVIVTFGHRAILVEALTRLAAALREAQIPAEVVVVDQPHPTRGHTTAMLVERLTAGVGLVRASSNLGFAGGNNRGVAETRAETVCLMNPDVLIDADQLRALAGRLDERPEAIVSPRLVFRDGRTQELGWRVIAGGETRPIVDGDDASPDYASAACWWLRREVFEELGGFDEAYHPAYYEDSDFALRAAAAGHPTVIADDVSVIHEWSFTVREVEPDVSAQRARFVSTFPDLVAERAGETRPD